MFGSLGGTEILVILVLALLLFGPRRLPQIGQTLGKALGEFRRATHEFRSNLEREVEVDRLRDTQRDLSAVGQELRETVSAADPTSGARRPVPERTPPSAEQVVDSTRPTDESGEEARAGDDPSRLAAEPAPESARSRDGEPS